MDQGPLEQNQSPVNSTAQKNPRCFAINSGFAFFYNTNGPKHEDRLYTLMHMAHFFIIFPECAL